MHNDLQAGITSDLVNFESAQNEVLYLVTGTSTIGDNGVKFYYYNSISSVTVDGDNVLDATGMGEGRYLKVKYDYSQIYNNPSLATVSTTGSYNDLTSKPTIPTISGATGTFGAVSTSNGLVTSGKRLETYSGTTNSSGLYTVTYGTAYSVVPNVQFQINGGSNKQTILLTSSTTTGFTVYVQLRADILGLLPTYSNVSGQVVDILVTEK